jgi:membrane protease subunit HflK
MPWKNQGSGGWQGGGDDGRGPWGQGPGGPQPPNLEELLRKGQDRFKGVMPRWPGGGRGLIIIGIIAVIAWVATGIYRVQPDEQGVVLLFGEWVETTQPGLHIYWPSPIGSVLKPKVTRVNRVDIGFTSGSEFGRPGAVRDLSEESLMLTGDENIIDIDFTVFWLIKDAGRFLFNIQRPEVTVKAVAESAMREVVGKTQIQLALAEGRQEVELATQKLIQRLPRSSPRRSTRRGR